MANDHTAISWTDATWNPTTGCDRVSAGCDHCYALTLAAKLKQRGQKRYQNDGNPKTSGPGFALTLHPDTLEIPLRWQKPRRVFVNSMSDLFHAAVPTEFIDRVWAVMLLAPQHTFQILTKRPQRMMRYVNDPGLYSRVLDAADEYRRARLPLGDIPISNPTKLPSPNIWLGTSVENQEAAYRIDFLARTPAAVRFLSCEPLIGPLDLGRWLWEWAGPEWAGKVPSPTLGWVIVGGESGPGYRPMAIDWAHDIQTQCWNAGVPFFFKQDSGRSPGTPIGFSELDDAKEFPEVRA